MKHHHRSDTSDTSATSLPTGFRSPRHRPRRSFLRRANEPVEEVHPAPAPLGQFAHAWRVYAASWPLGLLDRLQLAPLTRYPE